MNAQKPLKVTISGIYRNKITAASMSTGLSFNQIANLLFARGDAVINEIVACHSKGKAAK
jgi:hypothetical protein